MTNMFLFLFGLPTCIHTEPCEYKTKPFLNCRACASCKSALTTIINLSCQQFALIDYICCWTTEVHPVNFKITAGFKKIWIVTRVRQQWKIAASERCPKTALPMKRNLNFDQQTFEKHKDSLVLHTVRTHLIDMPDCYDWTRVWREQYSLYHNNKWGGCSIFETEQADSKCP